MADYSYDEVITLISIKSDTNDCGDSIETHTEREVFARLASIGQSEFYQAQAIGLKPEIKFVMSDYLDYQNEKTLKYQAFNQDEVEEYSIIRTFRKDSELELVCKRGIEQ